MLFICYPKCTTCQKARKWLTDNGFSFEERDIREVPPTAQELAAWQAASGLALRRFFNTSGQLYRSLALKDKLPSMSREEQLELLASDGMLVRRPLLICGDTVLAGFREAQWQSALLDK